MPDYRIREHPILPVPGEAVVPFTWRGETYKARPGGDHRVGPLRQRSPDLRAPPQGRLAAGNLLRERPVRAVLGRGEWVVGQIVHGAGDGRDGGRAARRQGDAPRRGRRPALPRRRDGRDRVPDPRGRAGGSRRGDRARQGRRERRPRRRQGLARRKARPPDAQVLRLHRGVPRRDARHGHRQEARGRGPLVPEREALDRDDGPGGLLGPEGGRAAGKPLRPRPPARPPRGDRSAREVARLQGEHASRRLRRGGVPDSRQPRPRAARRTALRRRRRKRRSHRRLPRAPGGDPGRGALRGARRLRRLQGPQGQAREDGRADPHAPHDRLGERDTKKSRA